MLADEAHGTHLYFGDNLPMNSMKAGADLAAISMHKSGGSLTQSSILLTNNGMNADYVQTIINITQTTSASYLLMTSLDISRRNLALRGRQSFAKVSEWAQYARDEINMVGGYYAYGKELINGGTVYDYDVTKLCVSEEILLDGGIECPNCSENLEFDLNGLSLSGKCDCGDNCDCGPECNCESTCECEPTCNCEPECTC